MQALSGSLNVFCEWTSLSQTIPCYLTVEFQVVSITADTNKVSTFFSYFSSSLSFMNCTLIQHLLVAAHISASSSSLQKMHLLELDTNFKYKAITASVLQRVVGDILVLTEAIFVTVLLFYNENRTNTHKLSHIHLSVISYSFILLLTRYGGHVASMHLPRYRSF